MEHELMVLSLGAFQRLCTASILTSLANIRHDAQVPKLSMHSVLS
jgi:hypothetical protein